MNVKIKILIPFVVSSHIVLYELQNCGRTNQVLP